MEHKTLKETIKDPQMLIAICVVALSICALFVSLFQAKIMNEQRDLMLNQAKVSVWPRLEVNINKSHILDVSVTS
jgi:hypothetical protein